MLDHKTMQWTCADLTLGTRMLLIPPSLTLILRQRLERVWGDGLKTFLDCTHWVATPRRVSPTRFTSATVSKNDTVISNSYWITTDYRYICTAQNVHTCATCVISLWLWTRQQPKGKCNDFRTVPAYTVNKGYKLSSFNWLTAQHMYCTPTLDFQSLYTKVWQHSSSTCTSMYTEWILTIDRSFSWKDNHNELKIHPVLFQLSEQRLHIVYSIYVPIKEWIATERHTSIVADFS